MTGAPFPFVNYFGGAGRMLEKITRLAYGFLDR